MKIGELLGRAGKAAPKDIAQEGKKELPELTPGMRLEVMTLKNRLIFLGRIEWVKGATVQIVDESGGDLPYIEFNSPVKVRGFSKGNAFCLQGSIGGSTRQLWRVEQLAALQTGERRGYFRQNVRLKAVVARTENPFEKQETKEETQEETQEQEPAVDCRISNISATGAMIETKAVFETGDWVQLTNVKVCDGTRPFAFICAVRRAIERKHVMEYGCEFYAMDSEEQERLIKLILRLQHDELKARRSEPDGL